ncbi:MAG: O-antigen/teichoic acid export membrane protein [Flavobacterium sp.]|jgi:O-antigen/teichoic acid export membrane protein
MGIVQTQSIKNTFITFFGFGIGAINALFFYTAFLGKYHYGITTTILSAANIAMPFLAFGVQNTLIRFYNHCKTEDEKDKFMTFVLVLPLAFVALFFVGIYVFYQPISGYFLAKNQGLEPFLILIPVIGLFMAYFEIFYAWVKVHMQSVVGNLISEVVVRVVTTILLFAVYFEFLSKVNFVYCLALAYFLQLISIMIYAFKIKVPVLKFAIPHNIKEILAYSFFIVISGGVAVMLVDFDKVMINNYLDIEENAVYSVAIFIATVIIVPSRAMTQIVLPITARLMAQEKWDELNDLYKKSAINLQVIGGLLMVGIFVNIDMIYAIIPGKYATGTLVVILIGLTKFYDLILGNNNAIILNTKYYRVVLAFGFLLVFLMVVFNMWLIPIFGIVGAALATLLSVAIYNTIKLLFVVKKLHLFPFTKKTLVSFAIIIATFGLFYFWDFSFIPFVNIVLKSILVTLFYIFLNYKLKVSEEVVVFMNSIFARLPKR